MRTTYEQIVDVRQIGKRSPTDMNAIWEMARQDRLPASCFDSIKRLLLAIDVQNDFIEGGALAVPGSIGDVERITRFIFNNMSSITNILCSQDTHFPQQIFHSFWWVNDANEHPAPYTIITYDDVVAGRWNPVIRVKVTNEKGEEEDASLMYLRKLKEAGKKQLCIWPYHCLAATDGASLENQFAKMLYFHSIARASINRVLPKGTDPFSEMYGIIQPEFDRRNFINTPILTAIEKYDEIYVVGEAASHCLMESVRQIAEHFANRPEITQKITILKDCTSPIPGYEADTAATFANFANLYGIKFANSTDIRF